MLPGIYEKCTAGSLFPEYFVIRRSLRKQDAGRECVLYVDSVSCVSRVHTGEGMTGIARVRLYEAEGEWKTRIRR